MTTTTHRRETAEHDCTSNLLAQIAESRNIAAYLAEHLDDDEIRRYGQAGAWSTAWLVALHKAGCTPTELRNHLDIGATIEQAIYFSERGWDAAAVAGADLPVATTLRFLRADLNDPRMMRRLHRLGVTSDDLSGIHPHTLGHGARARDGYPGLQLFPILADRHFQLDAADGPIAFQLRNGQLHCDNPDAFDNERAWCLLGGAKPSRAIRFHDAWHHWDHTQLKLVARGLHEQNTDNDQLRYQWLRTLTNHPHTPDEGPPPPRRRPYRNTCPACAARATLIAQRQRTAHNACQTLRQAS